MKILLPFKVFAYETDVVRIVAETGSGSFGILPHRLDCTAALVPGILTYETASQEVKYVAIDEGILIKTDQTVLISVRNAIGGADLGKLKALVEDEFRNLDIKERNIRTTLLKLESDFIRTFQEFQKS
jgi:F-type H+-transporting ATPase subunit epsilon